MVFFGFVRFSLFFLWIFPFKITEICRFSWNNVTSFAQKTSVLAVNSWWWLRTELSSPHNSSPSKRWLWPTIRDLQRAEHSGSLIWLSLIRTTHFRSSRQPRWLSSRKLALKWARRRIRCRLWWGRSWVTDCHASFLSSRRNLQRWEI